MFDAFRYQFFLHGTIAATLVGALCGLMGVYIVLRRMAYIGHGLSHAVFGGAVVAYFLKLNFYLGAGIWGFIAALLIDATARRRRIGADAAIGIVTTASFAFGVALISRGNSFTRNFEAALFGNILGVTLGDITMIACVTAAVVAAVFLAYKQLLFATFDPEVAPVYGVPVQWVDTGFSLALAATIVVSINVVGVTLIAAAIVVPPVIARLITDNFARVLVLSTIVGALTGFFGMWLSYQLNVASGAAIVLLDAAAFSLAFAVTGLRHGLLAGRRSAAAPAPLPGTAAADLFD
jgi:ABC-type Mn2+/Zn2+ transport system permease subunit